MDLVERLYRFEQSLKKARTVKSAQNSLIEYLAQFGITGFSYTLFDYSPNSTAKIRYDFASEPIRKWHEYYWIENYQNIDQTIRKAYQSYLPVLWETDKQLQNASRKKEIQMREESIEVGVVKGVSIPVHGPNTEFAELVLRQFNTENCLEQWDKYKYFFQLAAYYFHAKIIKILPKIQNNHNPYNLSERELQCLSLTQKALSLNQIATELFITERTVNFHIQNANKKLGVKNKHQALIRLKELGVF